MGDIVELTNVEMKEYCLLNTKTGEMHFSPERSEHGFTGLYYRDEASFFALYPTTDGPVVYYLGKEFGINKQLSIFLRKNGKQREFLIDEYNIRIEYRESPYIDFDGWSTEMDVDLFFMIEKRYKSDEFYRQYTTLG